MKFRHRIRGTSHGRRIVKGKSSESNPTIKRYREAAKMARTIEKSPFLSPDENYNNNNNNNNDRGYDTVLQQIPFHKMQIDDEEEEKSRNEGSERSWTESQLSQFTSCTNPTFDPVHRVWRSGSMLQNEVLAVLAATTELIRDKNGTESDTEYFAALLTVIEGIGGEDESRLASAAYLLGLVARKVDKNVARKCFSRAHQILESKLEESQSGIALAKIIATLGTILRHQAGSIWQSSNTRLLLVKIGMFAFHEKSQVRSAVRHVLRNILNDPVAITSNGYHPAAGTVGEFLVKRIEQFAGSLDADLLLRLLCLAENIMHKMPPHIFKNFAESMLSLISVSDSLLRCSIFGCFQKILHQQPADTTLSFDINVHLTSILRDSTSAAVDPFVTCSWMEALCESHVCLAMKDLAKSVTVLEASLKPIFQTFDSGKDNIAKVTYKVITRLIEHCVQSNEKLASYCLDLCDEALNPRSAAVWRYVLQIEVKIFEVCKDAISNESFERALKTLSGLRQDVYRSVIADIDLAVGAAVRHVGAEKVLRVLPLDLDPQNAALVVQFERSWLMPILRVNIHNQPITLALQYFLPLAHRLRKEAPSNDPTARKIFITISNQLWDLLPKLLSSASDFVEHFPPLAKIFGKVLMDQRDLRLTVLSSLRSALRHVLQLDAPEAKKNVMRFFAYGFLRQLFSLYTVSDATMESMEGISGNSLKTLRCSVLETARMYVDVTPRDVIDNFTNLAVEKAQIQEMPLDQKIRVLDLMVVLVKQASVSGLRSIFSVVQPWFTTAETAFQKKAFRILAEIMGRLNDETAMEFFKLYADEISNVLEQDLNSVTKSARVALLAMYLNKLQSLTSFEDAEDFAKKFLTAIIICLDKSHSTRTRSNALKCFVKLCKQLILFGSEESKSPSNVLHGVLETIFGMLNAEQGAEPKNGSLEIVRPATIALNVVAQKFVRILDASLLSRLVAHACSWIGDGRPPVRVLVIRLLRILAKKLPDFTMQQYQELLLSAVFDGQLTADVTHKVRKANRLLLEVLVDRYSVEVLVTRTDKPEWIKQLKAIAKIRRRNERRDKKGKQSMDMDEEVADDKASVMTSTRTAGADTILDMLDDSGSESEMGTEMDRLSIGGRTRGSSVWLKDDDDEDMVDLLDQNVLLKKIATVRPDQSKNKRLLKMDDEEKDDDGFKMTKDGRLIIENLDIDERSKRKRRDFSEASDLPDKKIKTGTDSKSDSDDDDGSDDETKTSTSNKSRWKPGGKGIHRDVRVDQTGASNKIRSRKKGAGDVRKKGEKYEPFVYIPLRKRKGQQTELKKIIKGAKDGAVHGSKIRKMRRRN